MLDMIHAFADALFGLNLEATELEAKHMLARGFVVFVVAVSLARIGARRFLGHNAGFDIIVLVILGSVLSRGINGDAAFLPTLAVSVLLVALHHVLSAAAFQWHWFSEWVKGRAHVLVRKGEIDQRELSRCKITHDDLDENIRLNGNLDRLRDVAEARLERNGVISVVPARRTVEEADDGHAPPTARAN